VRVVASALADAQHLDTELCQLDRGAQTGCPVPMTSTAVAVRRSSESDTRIYAPGSIRVVIAIRFHALITVIAQTS
jgi:hypothetical protein